MAISISNEKSRNALDLLRAVHFLELRYSSLKAVLHSVAQLKVRLPHLMVRHSQDSLDILKREPITLHTFERLSTTNQRLHILGLNFQDGSTIRNSSIKVANLLIAG
jgi:hypothetical protein